MFFYPKRKQAGGLTILVLFVSFIALTSYGEKKVLFEKDLIAYLSFDGGIKKGVSKTDYTAKLKGMENYVKGFSGKGLQIGDGNVLEIKNLPINTKEGTILIKLKPLWNENQKGNLWLLNVGGFRFFDLYKRSIKNKKGEEKTALQFRFKDINKKYVIDGIIRKHFETKKWYSLAICWDHKIGCSFYLDGQLIKKIEKDWESFSDINSIIIGKEGGGKGNKAIIDDLIIYNKDLPITKFFQPKK